MLLQISVGFVCALAIAFAAYRARAEAVVQEAVRASGPPPGTSPVLWMLGGSGRSDDDPLGL